MVARVLHLSDLHLGSRGGQLGGPGLSELVERVEPELIVVSGDLVNRGRREQFQQASGFLRGLGPPVLPVPGNHDLPYSFPGRFTHPWREFERQWATSEPVHRSDRLLVIGLNSARPWRQQSGKLRRDSLARAVRTLEGTPPDIFRVVFFHHHLTCAPWRARKRPLSGRRNVLRRLGEAGVDLICSGHIHQATSIERHEFDMGAGKRALVIATAPGLGLPRPRRQREEHGLQLYSFEPGQIGVETYIWHGGELLLTGERRFPR